MGKHIAGLSFCTVSLIGTLWLCWVLFPLAAMSNEDLAESKTPKDAELFEDVNIKDFGDTPVLDMVLHYIDNPPLASDEASPEIRFQGC